MQQEDGKDRAEQEDVARYIALLDKIRDAFRIKILYGRTARAVIIKDYPYSPRDRSEENPRATEKITQIIAAGEKDYAALLQSFTDYAPFFEKIPLTGDENTRDPFWLDNRIGALDGLSLYGLIAQRQPDIYMEIGGGNATKFARRAIEDHGLKTKIISIDPFPRAEIDALCDEIIRAPLEECDPAIFNRLKAGDMLFVAGGSHRAFPNSDVTVFFTEVLPLLKKDVIYGLRDIFLPRDYPAAWKKRFYNEQYLLHAYLLGGAGGDKILLPCLYTAAATDSADTVDAFRALFTHGTLRELAETKPQYTGGACFWMEKS